MIRLWAWGKADVACQPAGLEETDGFHLHARRFAVHVGHVEEGPLRGFERQVGSQVDGFLGQDQRHAVLGEGARVVSVQVARELVQHDDFSQPARRGGAPGPQLAGGGLGMQRQEALSDGGIEGRILAEMLFRRGFLEPEVQDGVRSGQGGGGCRHVVQGSGRVEAGGVACADGRAGGVPVSQPSRRPVTGWMQGGNRESRARNEKSSQGVSQGCVFESGGRYWVRTYSGNT